MFKNSAVVGAFGVGRDLYSLGESLTSAQGYAALPVLSGVAIGYLLINRLGWNCGDRRLNARSQTCGQS